MSPDSAEPMTAGAAASPDHRQETERAGQPAPAPCAGDRTDVTGFSPVTAPRALHELARDYIALVAERADITDRYWEPGMDVLPLFTDEDQRRIAAIDAQMAELREAMAG
jgi:hypothetical protein